MKASKKFALTAVISSLVSGLALADTQKEAAIQCHALCLSLIPASQSAQGMGEVSGNLFSAEEKRSAWQSLWNTCGDAVEAAGYPRHTALVVKSIDWVKSSSHARDESESSSYSAGSSDSSFDSSVVAFRKGKSRYLKLKSYVSSQSTGHSSSTYESSHWDRRASERDSALEIQLTPAEIDDPKICVPTLAWPEQLIPTYSGNRPVQG